MSHLTSVPIVQKITSPHRLRDITDISGEVPPAPLGVSLTQKRRIWRAAQLFYRTKTSPYIAICIRRHGQILLNRSIGYANAQQHIIGNTQTPVCIFSASKLIAAFVIHDMHDKQLINLDDDIGKYLPEYAINGKALTKIKHLLNHTAGLAEIPASIDPYLLFDAQEIYARLCQEHAQTQPGKQLAYHALTAGYVLGELVARVSGKNLHDYVNDLIAKPMDMPFFNYGLTTPYRNGVAINQATGLNPLGLVDHYLHKVLGGNLELAVDLTNDSRFMDTISPSANIFTNAEQLNRFMQMLLNHGQYKGKQIISRTTIDRALTPSGFAFDRTLMAPMRYGLGPMFGSNPVGLFGPWSSQSFGHLGFSHIMCWADPARDVSVSIMSTGKGVIGFHLPALMFLVSQISFNLMTIHPKQLQHVA